MPKNNDATRSRIRSKSGRRPLRDVSNAKTSVKPAAVFKKSSEENEEQVGDDSLDRLLLVHSDISSLLHQIDEIVVQALQLTGKKGRKEIKQFADVLSEMQTSLKPWVPRFQKAISSQTIEAENQLEQPGGRSVVSQPTEDESAVVKSPEPTKWESLVSPSPLVSWRAECNTEGGRQLFLLTPLPRTKSFLSKKGPISSISAHENITSDEIIQPVSLFDKVRILNNDLPEGAPAKPNPSTDLNIEANKTTTNTQMECASPSKLNCSMFVMSPCLKMSPPKSCILLEPVSEFCRKKNQVGVFKSTPFPARVQISNSSPDSAASTSPISDDLTLKYPELCGIALTHNVGDRVKVIEASSKWVVSPPKTCAIMEPSDEELLENHSGECSLPQTIENHSGECSLPQTTSVPNQEALTGSDHQGGIDTKNHYEDVSRTLDIAERTPMMKEPASCYRMGKHPGENTLKKELWARFEAATTSGIRFNGSVIRKTVHKGFLDRLEEAFDA